MSATPRGRTTATPNAILTWERQAHGWTQDQLADRLTSLGVRRGYVDFACDVRMVRRWESGNVLWPSDRYRPLLEDVFGRSCEALGFITRWRRSPNGDSSALDEIGVTGNDRVGDFATALLLDIDALSAADNMEGPRSALSAASQRLLRIGAVLTRTTGTERPALLVAASRYAEFSGWLQQDLGNWSSAGFWSDRAMEWAQEAGDPLMVSYVLMRKSNQASDTLDAGRTLGLANAAAHTLGASHGKLRALTLRQEAHAYALMRDESNCQRALDFARECAAEKPEGVSPELEESLAGYCTPHYIDAEAASCWINLGKPRRAVELLSSGATSHSDTHRRDYGLYLSRLARAHVEDDEPEQACAIGCDAIGVVRDAPSRRAVRELDAVRTMLPPAGQLAEARQFHDAWHDATTAWETIAP
jgi:transcriptional regulator with XRE-family HTH domain